ncbi:hypothetical protein ACO0QE_004308 [Hanseniaspora vineae]
MRFSTLFASSLLLLKLSSALPVAQNTDNDDDYEYETVTMYVTNTVTSVPTKTVTVLDTTTVVQEVTMTPTAAFTPIVG